MLFRRRKTPTRIEQLRVAVWPRRSWTRSSKYYGKRVLRLTATPNAIALGFAAGAFTSFTPFMGFHFVLSFALAYLIRGNLIASALGTAVGNPLTFPFIWAATYNLGSRILSGESQVGDPRLHESLNTPLFERSFDSFWPVFKPMLVGAVPLGLICAVICYFIVRKSVDLYQCRRRDFLEQKRQKPLDPEVGEPQ